MRAVGILDIELRAVGGGFCFERRVGRLVSEEPRTTYQPDAKKPHVGYDRRCKGRRFQRSEHAMHDERGNTDA